MSRNKFKHIKPKWPGTRAVTVLCAAMRLVPGLPNDSANIFMSMSNRQQHINYGQLLKNAVAYGIRPQSGKSK